MLNYKPTKEQLLRSNFVSDNCFALMHASNMISIKFSIELANTSLTVSLNQRKKYMELKKYMFILTLLHRAQLTSFLCRQKYCKMFKLKALDM